MEALPAAGASPHLARWGIAAVESDGVAAARISTRAEGRKDDRPETVRERLRVYHEETEPLIDYYETRGILVRVDGARTPDAVTYGIRRALEPVVAVH